MERMNIKSKELADIWAKDVDSLNHTTERLLKEVAEALKQVKDDADSTIVDEIYEYGNRIMEGSQQIFQGMTELFNMVNSIMNLLDGVIGTGVNIVKGVIGGIAGF